jgi:hypothetical protein
MVISKNLEAIPFQLCNKNKIEFRNGFYFLKQVQIQNLLNESLCIQLDSTLQGQLVFQLTNENLQQDVFHIATNTASTPQDFSRFNQVFNYVNHIHNIDLAPM